MSKVATGCALYLRTAIDALACRPAEVQFDPSRSRAQGGKIAVANRATKRRIVHRGRSEAKVVAGALIRPRLNAP